MKLKFLLDTNVVSEPVLRRPRARIVERMLEEAAVSAIAAPVWHELQFGVARLPPGARKDELASYLSQVVLGSFPILPYDEAAAAWHGSERARLEKAGRPAPFVDGQIAAIAFVNGLQLVTGNVKDFQRYQMLTVTSWR